MNIYRIVSDIINDNEFVVAPDVSTAIKTYCDHYYKQSVSEKNIIIVERISEKCLIFQY